MGNAVVQFEIGGPDDQLLAGIYSALFGWEMTPIPGANYTLIAASGIGSYRRPTSSSVAGPRECCGADGGY
jgi:hypothetical protein